MPHPRPATGLVSQGCYAGELADCDGDPPTSEHFVTRALLKRLGPSFLTTGLPWSRGPTEAEHSDFEAPILCRRHNNALSGLDEAICRVYDAWYGYHHEGADLALAIDGEDLERWSLKVICGMVAAKRIAPVGGRRPRTTIPREFLQILFGENEMPDRLGMYIFTDPTPEDATSNRIEWRSETMKTHPPGSHAYDGITVCGRVRILGFDYLTSMISVNGAQPKYRPTLLQLADGRGEVNIRWGSARGAR